MVEVTIITFGFVGWFLLGKHAVTKRESKLDYYTKWISLGIPSGWFFFSFVSDNLSDLILNPLSLLICVWCAVVTIVSVIFICSRYADKSDTQQVDTGKADQISGHP